MSYTPAEVSEFVREEDVKFIRLCFSDIFGRQKNISITASELGKAFDKGIPFTARRIRGFSDEFDDLYLVPNADTLCLLPWRPDTGKVARMFCTLKTKSGDIHENDTRSILKNTALSVKEHNFTIASMSEFYLFKTNEDNECTFIPYDNAGYLDIAPGDKGEDVRREICLTLEEMGISVCSSHHEKGPGQNEIDFLENAPLKAADDAQTFRTVVKTIAARNGLFACFAPKPLENKPGSGFHLSISVGSNRNAVAAGILEHISEMTLFFNPEERSYTRLGKSGAPKYLSWSEENRDQLLRFDGSQMVLRSPDSLCNPYIAYHLLLCAGLDGIKRNLTLRESYGDALLPLCLDDAVSCAKKSDFIRECLPESLINGYCAR